MLKVKALLFDVFGTVVDWRSGIANEVKKIANKNKIVINPNDFADAWRAEYQPAMEEIRKGNRSFTILDILHMENLKKISSRFGLDKLSSDDFDLLVKAWHRLPGWPDSSEGLNKLKTKFIIATQSNGNIALMVNMAKYSNLNWDVILGAEVVGHYKPKPEAYLKACRLIATFSTVTTPIFGAILPKTSWASLEVPANIAITRSGVGGTRGRPSENP